MTASQSAITKHGRPDQDLDGAPRRGGEPEPAQAVRAESYRRLWQPPGRRAAHRQALGQPYVWSGPAQPVPAEHASYDDRPDQPEPAWPSAPAELPARPDLPAQAELPARPERSGQPGPWPEPEYPPLGHAGQAAAAAVPRERAVIGDRIRVPMAWCQSGTCISWYADPDTLGEADVRARAIGAGWCVDVFGRLFCPGCQQRYHVWSARPLVPRTGRPAGSGT